jgi:hypothetical protein
MNLIDQAKVAGYLNSAYRLSQTRSAPDTARSGRPATAWRARTISIDLSHPETSGQKNFGVLRDSTMHFGIFFMHDARGFIWNTRDIPVGARIASDHADITFVAAGIPYYMQFGPWSISTCGARFGVGNGDGTDPVMIERLSQSTFRVSAAPGTKGRLWDYTDPATARDLGLYEMSFEFLVQSRP